MGAEPKGWVEGGVLPTFRFPIFSDHGRRSGGEECGNSLARARAIVSKIAIAIAIALALATTIATATATTIATAIAIAIATASPTTLIYLSIDL